MGEKYKPDVVTMDSRRGRPRFWGEAGHVGPEKIKTLIGRYPGTHFAIAKWGRALDPFLEMEEKAVHNVGRSAPVDLLRFPPNGADRFVEENGHVTISWDAVTWVRVEPAEAG